MLSGHSKQLVCKYLGIKICKKILHPNIAYALMRQTVVITESISPGKASAVHEVTAVQSHVYTKTCYHLIW